MKNKPGLLRATLIGGVMYLIPIVVLLAILGKAVGIANQLSPPIVKSIEAIHLGHLLSPQVIAILMLLLFCLAAGWLSQIALGKRIAAAIDNQLGNLPGYAFYRSIGESLTATEPTHMRRPVMVSIEDAWQLGMVVDELDNGLLAVYVPGVPEARSGSLYFMDPDRVRPLSISVKTALQTLRRMGVGSRELLKGEAFLGNPH